MCAMLAGLLEDALEASAQISDPAKRMIEVHIEPVHARLMIWVKYAAPGYLEMSAAAGNAGSAGAGLRTRADSASGRAVWGKFGNGARGMFFYSANFVEFRRQYVK